MSMTFVLLLKPKHHILLIKLFEISFDFFTKSFVTPLIAEVTTITLYFFLIKVIIFATFLILSVEPTDVPPNFNTTIFIDQFFYLNKYVDKIHLNCNVNYQSLMSTVDKKEIQKFSRIADEWWDVEGKFKPLHKFNPLRINYIKKQ